MRLSRYFLPVLKKTPRKAQIISHRYMLQAEIIKQASAGIYSQLPLGFKVLRKIENIIHQEQEHAGHIAIQMPTIQSADLWRESNRYNTYGEEILRIKDRSGREMLFTPTTEELVTDIFHTHMTSYKNLPLTLYQIQWKFRDKVRPRFSIMQGREFYMKDGYNFNLTKENALHAYNRHLVSYLRTYEHMGLQAIPMHADSSPISSNDTHEFLMLADTGESEMFYDSQITNLKFSDQQIDYNDHATCATVLDKFTSRYARTNETHNKALFNAIPEERHRTARSIEVDQIFYFGTKYSNAMGALVDDGKGGKVPMHMGSHRIGISRLLSAIIKASHDNKDIIWPKSVTPFHCNIVNLKQGNAKANTTCQALYNNLTALRLEPLYDNHDERAGAKFSTMDIIDLPWQITIGPHRLKNSIVELTSRRTGKSEELPPADAVAKIAKIYDKIA